MIVASIGASHRDADLDFLERISIPAEEIGKTCLDLWARESISEVVVLSTCLRTEVFIVAERFHAALDDVCDVLSARSGIAPDELAEKFDGRIDDEAVAHLFRVTSGIDSPVLGETEVIGQVRRAFNIAHEESTVGSMLSLVFRMALETGKAVRTQTEISRGATSIASVTVELAKAHISDLSSCRVGVVGAGEMAEGMLAAMGRAGVGAVTVFNRSVANAEKLDFDGEIITKSISQLPTSLNDLDLLLTSTGASSPLLEADEMFGYNTNHPILMIDVAVPRDIDAAVSEIDGVTLLNLDDLSAFASKTNANRKASVEAAEERIEDELQRYRNVARSQIVAPAVTALRDWAEKVRQDELMRHNGKINKLSGEDQELVDAITRSLVAKLLHAPTVQMKSAAGTVRGERLVDTLYSLFGLEP